MYTTFVIDFVSFLLLSAAFLMLWRERHRFHSLGPLMPALVFLSAGRVADMLLEHPDIRLLKPIVLDPSTFEILFAVGGNLTDALGISILIYGFVRIIKQQQEKEQHIRELETLLPLCANCKKYRTEEGQWMPIEKYLREIGAPDITHGICPDCRTRLYGTSMSGISG